MRIRWKALIPLLGIIGTWLASPQALALVSDRHAHVLLAISSLIAVLTPALVTDRPKASRASKRLKKAGLADDEIPPPAPLNQFYPPADR